MIVKLPELAFHESPNQSRRLHGEHGVRLIVVHTGEGSFDSVLNTILSPQREAAYHVLLDAAKPRRGAQTVPWGRKAWHAGFVNSRSDGIAVSGFADRFDVDSHYAHVLARMVAKRCKVRGIPARGTRNPAGVGVIRHADVDPHRRRDPTPDLREWRQFLELVAQEARRGNFRPVWGRD
jgi:N-acetyl-anhydromuramyl-L-alanine amidase AmpD